MSLIYYLGLHLNFRFVIPNTPPRNDSALLFYLEPNSILGTIIYQVRLRACVLCAFALGPLLYYFLKELGPCFLKKNM